jgi:hypothetical protein
METRLRQANPYRILSVSLVLPRGSRAGTDHKFPSPDRGMDRPLALRYSGWNGYCSTPIAGGDRSRKVGFELLLGPSSSRNLDERGRRDVDRSGGGLSSHPARGWVFLLALDHPSSRSVPSAFARASRHVVPACIVFTHSHVVRVRPIRRGPFRSPGTWGSTSLMWLMGWLHYPKMMWRSRPQHSSPGCSVRERGTRVLRW